VQELRPQLYKRGRQDPMKTVAAGWIAGEVKPPT
jgi:hypothetical protein